MVIAAAARAVELALSVVINTLLWILVHCVGLVVASIILNGPVMAAITVAFVRIVAQRHSPMTPHAGTVPASHLGRARDDAQ